MATRGKMLTSILSLIVLFPYPASRAAATPMEDIQAASPNQTRVVVSHVQLVVRDVEAEKKVFLGLGGTPIKVDGIDVMRFPGLLIFITQGTPFFSDNEGSVVNHFGFLLHDGTDTMAKLKAAGVKTTLNYPETDDGWVWTSESMRMDTNGDESGGLDQKVVSMPDHLHFDLPVSMRQEALAWYMKVLGAKQPQDRDRNVAFIANPNRDVAGPASQKIMPGPGQIQGIPDFRLTFGSTYHDPKAPLPTKGRTLDHVGFEVKNLEAFCKELEEKGVKLTKPYSKSRHKSYASAELTDPWGTSIELTEGLNRVWAPYESYFQREMWAQIKK